MKKAEIAYYKRLHDSCAERNFPLSFLSRTERRRIHKALAILESEELMSKVWYGKDGVLDQMVKRRGFVRRV